MWMKPPELQGSCSEYWPIWFLTMFLHILAYFFQLGYLEQNFKYRVLYFQVYVKIVEENRLY